MVHIMNVTDRFFIGEINRLRNQHKIVKSELF